VKHLIKHLLVILIGLNIVSVSDGQSPNHDLDNLPDCAFEQISGLEVGAVIYNFETGTGCVQNLDQVFPVASVSKIFVSGAYYQAVAQNRVSPSQSITFNENYYMAGDEDCLTADDLGREVSLRELSTIMITCSDNAATWMLMDALGWGTVQAYITSLGISGIGEVLPYAFVDQYKLISIDPIWEDVPTAMSSRYWRSRMTTGLGDYIRQTPRYERDQIRAANRYYFENYDYNTATPRAIAEYFFKLRDDYRSSFGMNWDIANSVLGEMLNTQRQYTTQHFPGTVHIGAKNGYDSGLVAEVNFSLSSVVGYNREPHTLALIFLYQPNGLMGRGSLNQYLWDLSPRVSQILFPEYQEPTLAVNWMINAVRFGTPDAIDNCWYPYRDSGLNPSMVRDFDLCLGRIPQQEVFANGQEMATGLVLRGMGYQDIRLTFIYIAPDGTRRSYQTRAPIQNDAGLNWFHPVNQTGTWELEIYLNLELVYVGSFEVE
jgi:hypothetical protein